MFPVIRDRIIALDLETTGLRWYDETAFGVAISVDDQDYYFDVRKDPLVFEWLSDELPKAKILINHHLKFDLHFLANEGVKWPDKLFCTMTAEAILDEHRFEYNLDAVAHDVLNKRKIEVPFNKNDIYFAPYELVAEYAKMDTRLALELFYNQCARLNNQDLMKVMRMEMKLLNVLFRMERHGVKVDIEAAEAAIPKLTRIINDTQADIDKQCGKPLNVNSTPQIRELFKPEKISSTRWQLSDGTIAPSTKTGGVSLNQEVLREMTHPIAVQIVRLRKYIKARDTFVKGHVLGHQYDGYVHTTFNQTKTEEDVGTGTGRLSSSYPALQQISKRDKELAEIIRSLFIPDTGHSWLTCDHSQIDFRIAAHLQNDFRIISAYQANPKLDYHNLVAEMMGIPRDPPYAGAPNAKQINLSLQFGAGAGKSAKTMKMPYTLEVRPDYDTGKDREWYIPGPEAAALFNKYHAIMPETRNFMKKAQAVAASRGYVKTILGRRIRFPGGHKAHKAAGLLYQSNAAEVHKTALIAIDEYLLNKESQLMISVHDEIGVSLSPDEHYITDDIKEIYCDYASDTSPFKLRVPITCSTGIGPNWFIASR